MIAGQMCFAVVMPALCYCGREMGKTGMCNMRENPGTVPYLFLPCTGCLLMLAHLPLSSSILLCYPACRVKVCLKHAMSHDLKMQLSKPFITATLSWLTCRPPTVKAAADYVAQLFHEEEEEAVI